ncbi:MAG: PAS domain S-box protein, partial [Chloroflexi bacterium]|nr:PAS domain S-box protein [Chloroflexota bacterium]
QRFRSVVEESPVGVGIVRRGIVLYANRATIRIFGQTDRSLMLGSAVLNYVAPQARAELGESVRKQEQGEIGPTSGEILGQRLDGSLLPLQVDIARVEFSDGPAAAVFFTDISERRTAQQALRESEARYRALVERTPGITYIASLDRAAGAQYVSPQAETLLGFSQAEWLADPELWVKQLHPQDRGRVLEQLYHSRATGEPFRAEYRLLARDGRTVWLHDEAVLVHDEAGRPLFDQGILVDITARKEVEEQLRLQAAVLEAAATAIIIVDRHGVITWVNPAFTRLTGYTAAEAVGQTPRILRSGKQDRAFYAHLWGTILSGEVWRGELVNRRKDGSLYAEEQTITPVRDGCGDISHFIAVKQDVSERRRLQEQLGRAQKMEAIGQFASGIVHNFANLQTVINGFADLLLAQLEPSDPRREHVEEIRKAGESATQLTLQLLAFSGVPESAARVVDLNAVVCDCENLLRQLIGEDVELALILAPDLGRVRAAPAQLEQVIMNLATNARDAMPRGGRLTIATGNGDVDEAAAGEPGATPPGRYVALTVSDTGAGMDSATQAQIFEPFFTTKGPGRGTGLGLSTVHSIVTQCGGYIAVESAPGQGTSFRISLPRIEDEVEEHEPAAPAGQEPRGTEAILVVEDNEGVRVLMRHTLEERGYTVLEAASAEDALALVQGLTSAVHLLIADAVLPGMSGQELVRLLAARYPQMKVLLMSGYGDDVIQRYGEGESRAPLLRKPFSPVALASEVRAILDERREG